MMNLQQKQINKKPAPVKAQKRTKDVAFVQPIVEQQRRASLGREMMNLQQKQINKKPVHIEERKRQKRMVQKRLEIAVCF